MRVNKTEYCKTIWVTPCPKAHINLLHPINFPVPLHKRAIQCNKNNIFEL